MQGLGGLGRLGGEAFVDHVLFLLIALADADNDCLQEVESEVVSMIKMTCTRRWVYRARFAGGSAIAELGNGGSVCSMTDGAAGRG